ncbi:MAG: ABC transporter substrate-binding protein, partial [Terriglobia bacterium]
MRSRIAVFVPSLVLLASVGLIAVTVERLASPPTELRIARPGAGYGSPEIRLGDKTYPREAVDSDSFVVRVAKPARRVASQYWSIDEYVYSVVPPDRVVAVSERAYEQRISNVFEYVQQFRPVIATDPERVLRLDPDLVIVSNRAREDFCALIRAADVPIYRAFTMFTTLEQVSETIRLTGYLTGEDEKAQAAVARFWAEINHARALRPANAPRPRILGFSGRYSYGDQTLFHDIVRTLGGINVGAEGGLKGYAGVNSEQIARWDPEWII